jgi:putative spermidine/putrescine transport system permease protein
VNRRTAERLKSLAAYGYVTLISAVILLPLGITIFRALYVVDDNGVGTLSLESFFRITGSFWPKIWLNLSISLFTILIDVVIGVPAAYAVVKYNFRRKRTIFTLLNGVWYVPGITYGMALVMAYFFVYKFLLGYWGYVAAYSTGFLFLMLLTSIVAFRHLDPVYEEAAACLGAGRLRRFFHVVLPIVGPGITAGILLIFVLSFNEFITALLLAGPTRLTTAPIRVFSDIRHAGIQGFVAAEAASLELISLAVVILYLKFVGTKYLKGVVVV